jgi:hypothetical protein
MKDKSKLHKKTITNKLGHKTSVWVKNKDSEITPPKGNKYETKVYHDTYGSAIDEIDKDAKSRGYEVNQDDLNFAFGDAFFKPKNGETRRKSVGLTKDGKVQKKEMHVQIYNTGNKFEYNAYVN